MKKFLKKLGIDLNKENTCIKCKKPISPKLKRCPHCRAWNDCCSIDPELLKTREERSSSVSQKPKVSVKPKKKK